MRFDLKRKRPMTPQRYSLYLLSLYYFLAVLLYVSPTCIYTQHLHLPHRSVLLPIPPTHRSPPYPTP